MQCYTLSAKPAVSISCFSHDIQVRVELPFGLPDQTEETLFPFEPLPVNFDLAQSAVLSRITSLVLLTQVRTKVILSD